MKSRCFRPSSAVRRLGFSKQSVHRVMRSSAPRNSVLPVSSSIHSPVANRWSSGSKSRSQHSIIFKEFLSASHSSLTAIRAFSNLAETTEHSSTAVFYFLHQIRQTLCQDILPPVLAMTKTSNRNFPENDESAASPPSPHCVVLLSISGGCDSVALLHSVMELVEPYHDDNDDEDTRHPPSSSEYPLYYFRCDETSTSGDPKPATLPNTVLLHLHVVHFDHCQRGEASDGDRQLVEQLAQSLGLPFHCYYWHDKNNHNDSGDEFSQEIARTWRINKLSELLQSLQSEHEQQRPGGIILTAHHQDDSNETLLLKLLRGVHLSNLSGMDPLSIMQRKDGVATTFGRPLLRVKKSDIVDYLQSRNLVWREDASNQSDKYLRNRVRNELLPLLTDLVGGDDSLQKRMDNIVQQSQEINKDTTQRAKSIMDTSASVAGNYILLPNETEALDYIHKQAIFLWANQVMQGHLLPYEQFVRLCAQLTDNPDNRQWVINIGGGWDVVRNGNSLQMRFMGHIVNQDASEQPVYCTPLDEGQDNVADDVQFENQLMIIMPSDFSREVGDPDSSSLRFVFTKSNVDGLLFTPSWRKDHTPIKLREFLRGQKVPLHLRSTAPAILAQYGSETYVVAVYVVEGDCRWVIDARFAPENSDESRTFRLRWQ